VTEVEDLSWLECGAEAPELIPIFGLTKRQLAAALNTNLKTIDKWCRDGLPARSIGSKRGGLRFDLPIVVEWLRDQERGDNDTLSDAKRKSMLAIAKKRDLEARKLAGELYPIDLFERYIVQRATVFRQRLQNIDLAVFDLTAQQRDDIRVSMDSALRDFAEMELSEELVKDFEAWESQFEKPSEH
jgi:hypothetical protein